MLKAFGIEQNIGAPPPPSKHNLMAILNQTHYLSFLNTDLYSKSSINPYSHA